MSDQGDLADLLERIALALEEANQLQRIDMKHRGTLPVGSDIRRRRLNLS